MGCVRLHYSTAEVPGRVWLWWVGAGHRGARSRPAVASARVWTLIWRSARPPFPAGIELKLTNLTDSQGGVAAALYDVTTRWEHEAPSPSVAQLTGHRRMVVQGHHLANSMRERKMWICQMWVWAQPLTHPPQPYFFFLSSDLLNIVRRGWGLLNAFTDCSPLPILGRGCEAANDALRTCQVSMAASTLAMYLRGNIKRPRPPHSTKQRSPLNADFRRAGGWVWI